jgi:ribonuclease HI
MMAYGVFIWWLGTQTVTTQRRLNHLQRVVCLAASGALRTTPQIALETVLNLPPFESFLVNEARMTAFRLRKNIKIRWQWRKNHSSILDSLYECCNQLAAPADRTAPSYIFDRPFRTSIPEPEVWLNIYEAENPNIIRWFTDASVNENGAGYGIFNANTETEYWGPLGTQAEITQSELAAIIICALQIGKNQHRNSRIHLYTDSQAAIKALSSYKVESKMVMDCINALTGIATYNEITLIWTPAHSSILGNEKADLLAKRGSTLVAYGPEPFFPITEKRCRSICSKWLNEKLVQQWRVTDRSLHTKNFISTPSVKLTEQFLKLTKLEFSITIGILTDHFGLNKYLKRIGVRDDPDCEHCGRAEESARHFLCECTALNHHRRAVYNKDYIQPDEIMSNSLHKIACFVKRSGRFPALGNGQILVSRQGSRQSTNHVLMMDMPTSSQQTVG